MTQKINIQILLQHNLASRVFPVLLVPLIWPNPVLSGFPCVSTERSQCNPSKRFSAEGLVGSGHPV